MLQVYSVCISIYTLQTVYIYVYIEMCVYSNVRHVMVIASENHSDAIAKEREHDGDTMEIEWK